MFQFIQVLVGKVFWGMKSINEGSYLRIFDYIFSLPYLKVLTHFWIAKSNVFFYLFIYLFLSWWDVTVKENCWINLSYPTKKKIRKNWECFIVLFWNPRYLCHFPWLFELWIKMNVFFMWNSPSNEQKFLIQHISLCSHYRAAYSSQKFCNHLPLLQLNWISQIDQTGFFLRVRCRPILQRINYRFAYLGDHFQRLQNGCFLLSISEPWTWSLNSVRIAEIRMSHCKIYFSHIFGNRRCSILWFGFRYNNLSILNLALFNVTNWQTSNEFH